MRTAQAKDLMMAKNKITITLDGIAMVLLLGVSDADLAAVGGAL